eukprot:5383966-Prorocentrum_lima.AAC.1
MTSSLVGSEMCIRDSHGRMDMQHCPPMLLMKDLRHNHHRQMQGALAVSYTHLTLPTICSV